MTDAPERIWLPLAHAEDAANMPAEGLVKYIRADAIPLSAALAHPAVREVVEAAQSFADGVGKKGVDAGSLRVDLYAALARLRAEGGE